jgi:glutathione synthase/RimK-type ligase-like ATP-grasp enzyme
MRIHKVPPAQRRRILLTNGRFPVALDLARQLRKVGHKVFTVDPMRFNITKFSKSVDKCFKVVAPHVDAAEYVAGVTRVAFLLKIDLIIPMHEEIFFLAQSDVLKPLLFAPSYHTLLGLHNKFYFYQLVTKAGLSAPPSVLCTSMEDVMKLDLANKEYALKPVFGRALSGIHHLKPGKPVPEIDFKNSVPYIAQEWIYGKQLCSYAVARNGEIKASAIYPVIDTIDGSSCVYFQSIEHQRIREFMEAIARAYNITGQIAFDFIDTPEALYTIECNPRATSGIHLFNKTPLLAEAFTNPLCPYYKAPLGKKMQMIPGMLMWENTSGSKRVKAQHMRRLFGTHDILFSIADPAPALMQPFLYATYVKRCREQNLQLKELFQWDLIWDPTDPELDAAYQQALAANDAVSWATYGVPSPANANIPTVTTTQYISTSLPATFAGALTPTFDNATLPTTPLSPIEPLSQNDYAALDTTTSFKSTAPIYQPQPMHSGIATV